MKQVKVRSQSLPWITNDIRRKMNRRFKLYKEALNTNDNEKWREYKYLRNKITAAVRRAKADFFRSKVNEVKTSRAYWRLVKDATNLSTCYKPIGPLKTRWREPGRLRQGKGQHDECLLFLKHSILKLIYKMYHNDLPSCTTAHIVKLQPSYNLRNRLRLEIPPFKSNIKKYSISYRGPILWNHMSIEGYL